MNPPKTTVGVPAEEEGEEETAQVKKLRLGMTGSSGGEEEGKIVEEGERKNGREEWRRWRSQWRNQRLGEMEMEGGEEEASR